MLLLALRRKDFPVDVNVARICARLGWIPLDSDVALKVRLTAASSSRASAPAWAGFPSTRTQPSRCA